MIEILFFCIGFSFGVAAAKLRQWLLFRRVRRFMTMASEVIVVENMSEREKAGSVAPANEQPAENSERSEQKIKGMWVSPGMEPRPGELTPEQIEGLCQPGCEQTIFDVMGKERSE